MPTNLETSNCNRNAKDKTTQVAARVMLKYAIVRDGFEAFDRPTIAGKREFTGSGFHLPLWDVQSSEAQDFSNPKNPKNRMNLMEFDGLSWFCTLVTTLVSTFLALDTLVPAVHRGGCRFGWLQNCNDLLRIAMVNEWKNQFSLSLSNPDIKKKNIPYKIFQIFLNLQLTMSNFSL